MLECLASWPGVALAPRVAASLGPCRGVAASARVIKSIFGCGIFPIVVAAADVARGVGAKPAPAASALLPAIAGAGNSSKWCSHSAL